MLTWDKLGAQIEAGAIGPEDVNSNSVPAPLDEKQIIQSEIKPEPRRWWFGAVPLPEGLTFESSCGVKLYNLSPRIYIWHNLRYSRHSGITKSRAAAHNEMSRNLSHKTRPQKAQKWAQAVLVPTVISLNLNSNWISIYSSYNYIPITLRSMITYLWKLRSDSSFRGTWTISTCCNNAYYYHQSQSNRINLEIKDI